MRVELKLAIVSSVVTALLSGVVGETWIRLTKAPLTPEIERSASLEYEASLFSRNQLPQLPQTTRAADGSVLYSINELGYRGRSFAIPKPPERVRVVVVGGSAAFDIGAKEGEDWPRLVELKLHDLGLVNAEVINAAVPGYATWDVLGRLYAELWMIQPDYVLIYEAWNDIKYFPWLKPQHSLARGILPPPSTETTNGPMVQNPFIYYTGPVDRLLCHSQLYSRLRRRFWWWRLGEIGLEGLVTGLSDAPIDGSGYPSTYSEWGPRQYELDLRLIAAASRAAGATPLLLTQAHLVMPQNDEAERRLIRYDYIQLSHDGLVRAFADCDAAVRRVASLEQIGLLDLSSELSGRRTLFSDHVHTTAAGSRAIADAVASFLRQQIAQPASPRKLAKEGS